MARHQIIIGRAELVDIVGVALGVPAKIDTGAYRSTIHATNIKEHLSNGNKQLTFIILGHPCSPVTRKLQTDRFQKINVTSSSGETSERYEVTLKVKIGPKIFSASFSLYDRSATVFPVLIGREALKRRFMVDPDKSSINRSKLVKDFGFHDDVVEDLED